ncbi:MAG: hypothetical protein ABIL58_17940 [Pseudomonadota bacterium]
MVLIVHARKDHRHLGVVPDPGKGPFGRLLGKVYRHTLKKTAGDIGDQRRGQDLDHRLALAFGNNIVEKTDAI